MKFFTLPSLLAAAVFSAVVVIPFAGRAPERNSGHYALQVRMASNRPGFVQLYYRDKAGALSETSSAKIPLVQDSAARLYRLPLPSGRYDELRFDPLTRPGAVSIESLQIVSGSGRMLRAIPLEHVKASQHIATLEQRSGKLEISTTPDGTDAQLTIPLSPPLELSVTLRERFSGFWPLVLTTFTALSLVLLALDRAPRLQPNGIALAQRTSRAPTRAVLVAAIAAVILSAYPIVFLGKSHVSPNFFPPLLYDDIPTLPGATSLEQVTGRGADLGAMMWQHLPYSMVQHRAVSQGELPLWNRYNSSGTPLVGQGQSMFGDPLQVGVMLANGAAWAWDLKYLAAKILFAFGLGLIVRRLTPHLAAALIVTIAAPFIGFFVYRISHPAYFSLCYAPWPLLCWLGLTQAGDRRAMVRWVAGLLAVNLAMMNSGTVKEAYMLLLAMNFSGACLLAASGSPWRERLLKLGLAAFSAILLLLITAPLWATFLHTLGNSQTNYELKAAYQIQPSLLLGAFDEAFFRLIMPDEFVFNPSLNFLFLLGLLYFVVTLRLHRANRAALALAASSLVPLALVFGVIPPSWITEVPLLGRVQHIDNCFLCALIVLWAALAGVGFATAAQRLATPEGARDLRRMAWWLVGLVGVWIAFRQAVHRGAFGPGMTFSVLQNGQVLPVSRFIWIYLATLLVASALLAATVRRALVQRTLSVPSGFVLALCLIVLLWRHGLHASTMRFDDYVVQPPPRADLHAASPAVEKMRAAQRSEPSRGYGLGNNFFMGWTAAYGLEAINGPDALMNSWYRELLNLSGVSRGISWDFVLPAGKIGEVRPFFDALNVKYYFSRGLDDPALRNALTFAETLDLDVWESPTVWPRAFFTDRVIVYDEPAELMQQIKSGDGRPFAAVQRKDAGTMSFDPDLRGRQIATATGYQLTENTTAFDIKAAAPGVVVLTETYWAGDFRVEINGRKAPVLRLNHAFKGVPISGPGDYRIVFRYVPRNFPRHLQLAALGAILLLVFLAIGLRRPRRELVAAV